MIEPVFSRMLPERARPELLQVIFDIVARLRSQIQTLRVLIVSATSQTLRYAYSRDGRQQLNGSFYFIIT